jgi:hypothetical protein
LSSILSLENPILPRHKILKWLKPQSTTTFSNTLVGFPWEIYRSANLTPAHPHTIDIYSKGGASFGYEGTIGVIEQYGVGYSILTAGAKGIEAQQPLNEALLATLMPAIEEATRAEAHAYVGSFTGDGFLKVEMDDGPGLVLANLSRNGSDILDAIKILYDSQFVSLGLLSSQMRLYPTDISRKAGGCVEEEWRLQYDTISAPASSDLPRLSEAEGQCVAWWTGDALYWGGEPIDRFVFVRNGYKITEVRIPSLRLNLTAAEGGLGHNHCV